MRGRLKSEDSISTMGTLSEGQPSYDASASFRTAATSATSQSVGSSLLRNLLPSRRQLAVSEQTPSRQSAADRVSHHDVDGLLREVNDLRGDLDMMRMNRQQEQRVYHLELRKLECEKSAIEKRMAVLLRDMNDKNAMGEYATLIRKAAPSSIDSTYVLKLQAQLAKAMHQMGVIQNQLTLTQQACDGIVKELRDEMKKTSDQGAKQEIDYLNQIMKLQDDNITMKRELDAMRLEHEVRQMEKGSTDGGVPNGPLPSLDEDAPPPLDGIRVKSNSKSKLESSSRKGSGRGLDAGKGEEPSLSARTGGHRKPSSAQRESTTRSRATDQNKVGDEQSSGSGRRLHRSSRARAAAEAEAEAEAEVSVQGKHGDEAPSRSRTTDQITTDDEQSSGSGRRLHRSSRARAEAEAEGQGMQGGDSPSRSRAVDQSKRGDEQASSARRGRRASFGRAQLAAGQGRHGDDSEPARPSQRKPTSRTKSESQQKQQQQQRPQEGPAFGEGLTVKSSSKSKGDFPKSSEDDDDGIGALPEIVGKSRSGQRRNDGRERRKRIGKSESGESEWVAFGESADFSDDKWDVPEKK